MMSPVRRCLGGRAVLALSLALATITTRAAVAEETVPEEPDPRSVYQMHPWLDGSVIVTSNVLSASLYFGVRPDPTCPCDPLSVNSFDRHAISNHSEAGNALGTSLVVGASIMPLALDLAILGPKRVVLEDAVVLAEALSVSGALVSIAKVGFSRPYPRTYAGEDTQDRTNYQSFYSGHTAITFTALSAMAVTVGRRYHSYAAPWALTVVVGSAVGASMVWSGWHFPTDVIVGAGMGTAVGVTIPALHFREAPLRPVVMKGVGNAPLLGLAGSWR
jgi:membrane-associated phospholipid phosphatase